MTLGKLRFKAKRVRFHRNGVSGAGFFTVEFRHDKRDFVGVVFDMDDDTEPEGFVPHRDLTYAVFPLDDPSDCQRGDHFIDQLFEAITVATLTGEAFQP